MQYTYTYINVMYMYVYRSYTCMYIFYTCIDGYIYMYIHINDKRISNYYMLVHA